MFELDCLNSVFSTPRGKIKFLKSAARILLCIAEKGTYKAEIVREHGIPGHVVEKTVETLVQKGFLEKEMVGNRSMLMLTREGREAVKMLEKVRA